MRASLGRVDPVRSLMLSAVRPDGDDEQISRLASSVDPAAVLAACQQHAVVSLVHERLRTLDGHDPSRWEALERRRLSLQIRCLELDHTLATAGSVLDVPWLSVKGDMLAQWYDDPTLRDYGDLDLLVRPSDFVRSLEALTLAGIVPVSDNWRGFREHEVAEVPLASGRSVVDLHWHVVAMGDFRRHFRLPTDELIERAVPVALHRPDVRTLDPVDTLVHLCVNAGLDGGRRLRNLVDVDRVLRTGRIDLDELVGRVRESGSGRLVAALLQRASNLVGTPVPDDLLDDLCGGRTWLMANRLIDRTAARRSADAGIASGVLLGSGRPSSLGTYAALGRTVGRLGASLFGRAALAQPGGALDWQRRPVEGAAQVDRADYLAWVARQ